MNSCARKERFVVSLAKVALLAAALLGGIATEAFAAGSISGRVTGSDGPGAGGLLNTVVQFYDLNADTFAGSTTTDATGNYTMNLPAGSYAVLTQNIAGYINKIHNNIPCSAVCDTNSLTPVVVTTTAITNINFVLDPGSRISGTITDSVTGSPIAGVKVQFVDPNGQLFFTSAVTNASGNYISDGGSATGNIFAVTENSLGYQNEAYNNIKCLGCNVTMVGTPIAVTLGTPKTGIDFALDLGGRITGHVETSSHSPLANVEVEISNSTGNRVDSVVTDASGNFTSGGLPSGTYYAGTRNFVGLADMLWQYMPCASGFCNPTNGTPIAVTALSTTGGINFVLSPGGTITGTIINSAGGAPIANASVSINDASGAFVGGSNANSSGVYTTGALPTGTYSVNASATGFVNQVYNNVSCGNNCNINVGTKIIVVANAATTSIDFSLIATGTGSISGVVTDTSTALPVNNLQVQVFNASGGMAGSANTNSSGVYTVASLPTGSYYVRTNTFGTLINQVYNGVTCVFCTVQTSGGTFVKVTNGATTNTIDFALSPGGRISGTVTSAVGGGPSSGVPVQVFNSAGVQTGSFTTSTSGVYTTAGLPPGTYYLRTSSNLWVNVQYNNILCPGNSCSVTAGTPVVVAGTATTPGIDFALPSAGNISGTVTNAVTGAPIQSVPVQIFTSTGVSVGNVNTDASGNYTSTGLPPGTYYARTNTNGVLFLTGGTSLVVVDKLWNNITCVPACLNPTAGTPITVALLATTTGINFSLASGGLISGTVTDAGVAGAGLPLINVQIYTSAGVFAKSAVTNSAGGYTLVGLPTGTYYARTSVPATQFYQDELFSEMPCGAGCTVTAGSPITVVAGSMSNGVSFTLASGAGSLSGTVTDAGTSAGISAVGIVEVYSSGGIFVKSASTNATGAFTVGGLAPGTYFARTQNSLGYRNELYRELPCGSACTVTSGTPITVAGGATTTGINFTLVTGGLLEDLSIDFGSAGLWIRYNNATWTQLHTASPAAIATGDVDNDGHADLIATFPGAGVWMWKNNSTWIQLHALDASAIATGDIDGNGLADVILVFPGFGVWVYANNSGFVQLHTQAPDRVVTGDLDGNGKADVILNFPGQGIWVRFNNATWSQLHASNGTGFAVGDFDGSGKADLLINFPGAGLWLWSNNASWTQLHASNATVMTAGDIDGSGKADAIIAFSGFGVWIWKNNSTWLQLHTANADMMTAADVDGNGRADLAISFPGAGIWMWMNDTSWNQLHTLNPQSLTPGNLDGN